MDVPQVITSLFIMLNQNTYVLFRIEVMVLAITVLFLVMFAMDFVRKRSHGALRKSILDSLDSVSDNVLAYTLGAMRVAPFKNQLFPVWAMVVITFRSSINYISRRDLELGNILRPWTNGFLKSSCASGVKVQLWTLWMVALLRIVYRSLAGFIVSKSIWSGHRVDFVSDYMRGDHENSNLNPDACNSWTMEGYTYLVYGESSQEMILRGPRYILYLNIIRPRQLVTLDKIWQCDGRLLRSNDSRGDHVKDLCLAFSLSRLLRCRVADARLHGDFLFLTRNLVRSKILMKSSSRAFRILELELMFLNDSLHTQYPIVFCRGFCSLAVNLAFSCVSFGVTFWLAVEIHKLYRPQEGDLVHIVHGANVDTITTWVFMLFMMFKEIWEMVTYLLSGWTRLVLVCKYVQWRCRCMRNSVVEKLIWSFFTSKIGSRWHGLIDQYEFLGSFDYIPSIWNGMYHITLGMIPRKNDGADLGKAVQVPECVKPAILRTLRRFIINLADGGNAACLPNQVLSLHSGDLMARFGWACRLPRCSQVLLVWHIATSLCEINLALDHGVDLRKPGLLWSALSWLTSFCNSSSQPRYLVPEKNLAGEIKTYYLIANSLSRYCAYLLISQPQMLPDTFMLPDLIFKATVEDARQILKDTDSLHSRYTRLTEEANQTIEMETTKGTGNLVQQGAVLGWDLIQLDGTELRWKILAGVWADLIVHIAPTWKVAAHKKRLEFGGEFITQIWALLCQLGIEKSSLWSGEEGD